MTNQETRDLFQSQMDTCTTNALEACEKMSVRIAAGITDNDELLARIKYWNSARDGFLQQRECF